MNRTALIALAAVSVPLAGFLTAQLGPPAPIAVAQTPGATPADLVASPTSAEVVDAAEAFLATLSDEQRTVAQIGLKPELAVRWTNLPGDSQRNGIFFHQMKPEQAEAALKVARAALGEEGFTRFQDVRAADDAFAKGRGGRGPGGPGGPETKKGEGPAQKKGGGPRGGMNFGSGHYMIAFLGQPSKTNPWLLQLGGHHLAFNIYYRGATAAPTPYHVAAQPTVWKDEQGTLHDPLAPMRDPLHELLASLTPEQLGRAKLAGRYNDMYVGPGRDGKFPAKSEGIPVGELPDAAKALVRKAIAAWTGDSPQGAEYRKLYEADLDKIRLGYSGTPNVGHASGDYVRLDGPRVWIEFATQGNDHYHTIWRDRLTDYGAEFSF